MVEMTKQALLEICKERDLYRTPGLNDRLHARFRGFSALGPALAEYANLKALFLEGNALTSLAGLPRLEQLKCL